jgi:hypothetical protein
MKFSAQLFTILILALLLELIFPWWTIAIAGFIGGLMFNTRGNFAAGFLAIAILWTAQALIVQSSAAAPLAERVAAILMVKKVEFLFLLTAVIGGLVGGFAAMSGSALRKKKKKTYYY